MEEFYESDLYNVATDVMKKAATTKDRDYQRLAADFAKVVADHEKNKVEGLKNQLENSIEKERLEAEKKEWSRQHKMEWVKLTVFVGVTVAGVAIENKYMVSSWFSKTFLQKAAPKI